MKLKNPSFAFWSVVFITLVYSMVLAWRLVFSETYAFAYGEQEYLNLLFGQNVFHTGPFTFMHNFPPTLQNANVLSILLICIADFIPIHEFALIWAGQTLLCGLLLFRLFAFLKAWIDDLYFIFFIVLAFSPLFWSTFLYNPSTVLIALLLIELLVQCASNKPAGKSTFFLILLLGFCGIQGFFLSLLFVIILPGTSFFFQGIPIEKRDEFLKSILVYIAGIMPAVFIYFILTLQSQELGGSRLIGWPTLFSVISIDRFLTGEWSTHFRQLLIWFGNGCMNLGFAMPLFGLLALLGCLQWIQGESKKRFGLIISILGCFYFILFAFLPLETAQRSFFPLYLIGLAAVVQGICWLTAQFKIDTNLIIAPVTGVLVFLSIYSFPSSQQPFLARARYKQDTWSTIQSTLQKYDLQERGIIAVRFAPSIWIHLPKNQFWYPIGLTVRNIVHRPTQLVELVSKQTIEIPGRIKGGINYDLAKSLLLAPEMVLLFPSFDEARQKILFKSQTRDEKNKWLNILETSYQKTQVHHVKVYVKNQMVSPSVSLSALQQIIHEGRSEEFEVTNDWLSQTTNLWELPIPGVEKLLKEEEKLKAGMQWTFEKNYESTRQVGLAFGFSPDETNSPVGACSAGPTSEDAYSEIGEIHSTPFVIEGDDLLFMADLPKESTASLFCLAVHSRENFGQDQQIRKARHIFDHLPDQLLMTDTFYYIRPSQLVYSNGEIIGWRVVRVIHGGEQKEWQPVSWSINPWINHQAIWMAADRDITGTVRIDHIMQRKRPPGFYWNFEDGTYNEWIKEGEAFGQTPASSAYGKQQRIQGYEGNYFVNTYYQGSDEATGILTSPAFTFTMDTLEFLIGGGDDPEEVCVQLLVEDEIVLRAAGKRSETLYPVKWDISQWEGKQGKLQLVDASSEAWGHLLVDDIRLYNSLPRRLKLLSGESME